MGRIALCVARSPGLHDVCLLLRCKIDFAEQSNWIGVVDEMELATGVSLLTQLGLTGMAVAIVQAAHAFYS